MNIQITDQKKYKRLIKQDRYKFSQNSRFKKLSIIIKIIAVSLIIICLFTLVDNYFKPTVNAVSLITAKNQMTQLISSSVSDYIESNQITYDKLMSVHYGTNNKINSITTDMIAINNVRNGAINSITDKLENGDFLNTEIPLGTLLRTSLFSGRGPKIPFKILKMGAIETKFDNSFEDAGINQTKHTITLNISILINAQVPFHENTTTVTEDIIIAESIIVGDVPQYMRAIID